MNLLRESTEWREKTRTRSQRTLASVLAVGRIGRDRVWEEWQTLAAWHSNTQQLRHCLQALDQAGVFRVSPDSAALCDHIAQWRHRPIHLIAFPFTPTISGLVIARPTHDTIYFAEQAHPILGMQTILHELGHLLLGHVQHGVNGTNNDDLTAVEISAALKRSCYDHVREVQAERMAYLMRRQWLEVRPPQYRLQRTDAIDEVDRRAWERFTTFLAPLDAEE
ncbi:MAG: hypothetical protein H0X24_00365 [Ktedonobacterales bacterium]|nr:hypothetical protein [Ktedonobacterales bacterium]